MKIVTSILSYLLLAFLLLILIAVLVVRFQGKTPNLFGYRVYTVVSPSMEPELMTGDVILSKKASVDNLKENDIVSYVGEKGSVKDKLITHKIKSIFEEDGTLYVITRGVANDVDDPKIEASKIEAVMVSKVAWLTSFYKFANTIYGYIVLIAAPLTIILVIEIVSLARRKKKRENN